MRLFAEEKRSGTIELLLTSPVQRYEIILGKWLGAMLMYLCMLGVSAHQRRDAVRLGQARLEADAGRLPGPDPAGRRPAGHRHLHLHHHQKPDHRRRRHFLRLPAALGAELGQPLTMRRGPQAVAYCSILTHFETFPKASSIPKTWSSIYPRSSSLCS